MQVNSTTDIWNHPVQNNTSKSCRLSKTRQSRLPTVKMRQNTCGHTCIRLRFLLLIIRQQKSNTVKRRKTFYRTSSLFDHFYLGLSKTIKIVLIFLSHSILSQFHSLQHLRSHLVQKDDISISSDDFHSPPTKRKITSCSSDYFTA